MNTCVRCFVDLDQKEVRKSSMSRNKEMKDLKKELAEMKEGFELLLKEWASKMKRACAR